MTSDDTHEATAALLAARADFGLAPGELVLLKQAKVPALLDAAARVAPEPDDAYAVQTKPHGHGDVHLLLHASGIARRWRDAGVKWAVFFQDTNGLAFRQIPMALGASATRGFDFNFMTAPRKAKVA